MQSRAGANSQPQRPVNISDVVRGVITRLPFSLLCSEVPGILTPPRKKPEADASGFCRVHLAPQQSGAEPLRSVELLLFGRTRQGLRAGRATLDHGGHVHHPDPWWTAVHRFAGSCVNHLSVGHSWLSRWMRCPPCGCLHAGQDTVCPHTATTPRAWFLRSLPFTSRRVRRSRLMFSSSRKTCDGGRPAAS